MVPRIAKIGILMALVLGFAATEAFAFRCPKLIGAGRRLAAKAMGGDKDKAIQLLNAAQADHDQAVKEKKDALHTSSMQKATDAIDLLVAK